MSSVATLPMPGASSGFLATAGWGSTRPTSGWSTRPTWPRPWAGTTATPPRSAGPTGGPATGRCAWPCTWSPN